MPPIVKSRTKHTEIVKSTCTVYGGVTVKRGARFKDQLHTYYHQQKRSWRWKFKGIVQVRELEVERFCGKFSLSPSYYHVPLCKGIISRKPGCPMGTGFTTTPATNLDLGVQARSRHSSVL